MNIKEMVFDLYGEKYRYKRTEGMWIWLEHLDDSGNETEVVQMHTSEFLDNAELPERRVVV